MLSWVIWIPIIWGLLVLAMFNAPIYYIRALSLAGSVITLLISLILLINFDANQAGLQFVEDVDWISSFNIKYGLGIDGIALTLILLNSVVIVLTIIAGWQSIHHKVAPYMAAFLLMCGFVNGVFSATDAILFYIFWEATLIPLFIVIGIWGGERRVYAAIKFFLYTFFGSLLMLIAFLYLYSETKSFDIYAMHDVKLAANVQAWIFFAFLAAFAVKIPMFPVHTWLPDAHVEAPTGGSIILAAIMLKLGGYGLLRFSLPIVPNASNEFAWLMITLSLIAIIYIGLVALVQKDMKKLVAYSSVAHMGFVTLGAFLFDDLGITGSIYQMISHGFISGAMFFCIGVLYDRLHTRMIGDYGGVANTMPKYAAFLMLFAMANAGLPGTSGFVGEFMVILAAIKSQIWVGILAATTLITGAAYSLWMYKRVIFGAIANDNIKGLIDLRYREFIVLGVFAFLVLLFGIYPLPITEIIDLSVQDLVSHVKAGKL